MNKKKLVHTFFFLQNVCLNMYLFAEYNFLHFDWWAMVKIQKTFRNTCFLAFSLQRLEILEKWSYNKLFYVKFPIKECA